jgi:hypothetical protein
MSDNQRASMMHSTYGTACQNKGFFDPSHYNSSSLENCHYNSGILKTAITIVGLHDSCHFLHIPAARAHCQTPNTYTEGVWTPVCLRCWELRFSPSNPGPLAVVFSPSLVGERRRHGVHVGTAGLGRRAAHAACGEQASDSAMAEKTQVTPGRKPKMTAAPPSKKMA